MRLSRSLWAKTRPDGLPLITGMLFQRLVPTIHRRCCDKTPDFHGLCQTEWIPWAVDRWVGAQRPPADRRLRLLVEFLCPGGIAVKHAIGSSGSSRIQRTGHTERLGVQIAHGRFERLVSHCALNGPRIGPTIKTVCGIGMTQFMGQDE